MDFCRRALTEHRKDQFQIIHMIAEIVALEVLEFLVFTWSNTKCCLGNFSGQDFIVALFTSTTLLPLISQFFTNRNAAHTFFNPITRVAFELVKHSRAFGSKLR